MKVVFALQAQRIIPKMRIIIKKRIICFDLKFVIELYSAIFVPDVNKSVYY